MYCIKCNVYRKFKNPKIYIFNKISVLSIIGSRYLSIIGSIYKKESIEIFKIIVKHFL